MSSYFLPGAVAMWGALAAILVSTWSYWRAVRLADAGTEADPSHAGHLRFARATYACFAVGVLAASGILMFLLLTHQYGISYVYSYSSSDLPLHYLISTFWAGQEGSFMLWLFWGAVLGFPLIHFSKEQEAPVMIVYNATLVGLVLILVKQSPFTFLPQMAADGEGLNPLLQDPWMVIHPPVMFMGFASLGYAFSFAMAGLWKKRYDSWIRRALPFTVFAWMSLGTAILMGGYWAYKTLGWGGYWGWDPVENTSLIPWIATTALIHGMYVQRKKERYRKINFALAAFAYLCILYGTFLTRSGVLADFSVHSFVDLGITGWLVGMMGFAILLSVVLMALRFGDIPVVREDDPVLSRGVFLLTAISVLLVAALLILLGTSAPLITRLSPNQSQVNPAFYNVVGTPIGIALALLMGLVPYIGWSGRRNAEIARKMLPSALFGVAAATTALLLGARQPMMIAFIALAAVAFASNLLKVIERGRKGGWREVGGYLAHTGMGIMLVGIVVSGVYASASKVTLTQGQPHAVGDYTMTFEKMSKPSPQAKEQLDIKVRDGNGATFMVYPKLYVNSRTQQTMANPYITKYASHDLYVSPIQFEPSGVSTTSETLDLGKGEEKLYRGTAVRFTHFDLQGMGTANMTITANLEVRPAGAPATSSPVPLRVQYFTSATGDPSVSWVDLPGSKDTSVSIQAVNAADKSVRLVLENKDATAAPTLATIAVDVTKKPLINLVWYGFYVIMLGGFITLVKRSQEAV